MKKILLPLLLLLATAVTVSAQSAKTSPPLPKKNYEPWELKLNSPKMGIPPAENPFGLPTGVKRQPLPPFTPASAAAPNVRITRGENGLPILFEGQTEASGDVSDLKTSAIAYLASLRPQDITDPAAEFLAKKIETDELGNAHIRLEQVYRGVSVFGGEVIAHTRGGVFALLNGRYFPTPTLATVVPALDEVRAIDKVKAHIGLENIKTDWKKEDLALFDFEPFKAELVVYHHNFQLNNERLAWLVTAHPTLLSRLIYFVDAQTGEVIHHYDYTCKIHFGLQGSECGMRNHEHENPKSEISNSPSETAPPPVNGTGIDLLNVNRTFGAWQQGSTFYLEDASKAMFNSSASTMPSDPVGAIVTLDAGNTSPQNQNFDYNFVTSASTNFSNNATSNGATAVSAHWNSIKSYDYFLNTHGRNSIDGVGGNILAFINVSEDDGSSMENAYWNGEAMWYGNGGTTFKKLARGLDVGGHEMTHGVVEKTANLVYQNESGALNESFADIFGAMIDRDDWLIGEDVMQPGTNAALRSMQDPHNGVASNSPWWQPRTVSEQFTGSGDNGGVHINSGIPNWAFYLFANNASVNKDKAEKVYYKALKDYLVKSSKFVDLRIAVLQSATELYGNSIANIAASAFDQVGILGSSPGGNYLGDLQTNPGTDFILCVTNNYQNLDIANGTGTVFGTIYAQGVKSRPSISDNGSQFVFVNSAGHIISVDLVYNGNSVFPTVNPPLSAAPIWRNAAISKDGRFVAALLETSNNSVFLIDLFSGDEEEFELYNPTYSTGQITGEVQFADVLEFDYSGEYIMYDAFNELSSSQSGDISYWDIGFLQFWENNGFADPSNYFISKLFSGLPEKTSVGDPTFSKNSPYIIAFDFLDETTANTRYDIYGANTETGDANIIVSNNGDLGWPNYNRLDNILIYEGPDQGGTTNIYRRSLNPDKISGQNNETQFIANRNWGVWYANGNRSLMVDTDEPNATFNVSVAPNPTTDFARLNIGARAASDVQISIVNLLGETLQIFESQLVEGENQVNLNLRDLPSGTYVVRVFSENSDAAVKVVKQ